MKRANNRSSGSRSWAARILCLILLVSGAHGQDTKTDAVAAKPATADTKSVTVGSFDVKVPPNAAVEEPPKDLPAARELDQARELGKLALHMAPSASLRFSASVPNAVAGGRMKSEGGSIDSPSSLEADLKLFKEMLQKGTNPDLIRIKGFRPAREEKIGTSSDGRAIMQMDFGAPGMVVLKEEGGLTLAEYFAANKLDQAAELLRGGH